MALPDDREARLRCYRCALENWNYHGYVNFSPRAQEWLASQFPDLSLRDIARELSGFVASGGEIDEQVERRPEYVAYEFHYDVRVQIAGRMIYFETVLLCEDASDPDDPQIEVVNVHDV